MVITILLKTPFIPYEAGKEVRLENCTAFYLVISEGKNQKVFLW